MKMVNLNQYLFIYIQFECESDPNSDLLLKFEPKTVTQYTERKKPPNIFGEAPPNHTPLYIAVNNLIFYDHYYFTKEDRLNKLIKATYSDYSYAVKNSKCILN